jgi:hypothetical protein
LASAIITVRKSGGFVIVSKRNLPTLAAQATERVRARRGVF